MLKSKLYDDVDDFHQCTVRGIELISSPLNGPAQKDLEDMRALLAIFITASIKMDPEAVSDPDFDARIGSVRIALLAAYNLGKDSALSIIEKN